MLSKLNAWAVVSAIALLFPRVAVIVIAARLPEAGAVLGEELDALQPLRALPEIEPGNHHAHRPAMLARDRLALPAVREQRVGRRELGERDIGRVAVEGMEDDMARLGLGARKVEDVPCRDALPAIAE